MTTARTGGTSNLVLATLSGLLVVADIALAAIGSLVWNAYRQGSITAAEAASFTLLAASAAVGAVVMLLVTIALIRGARGHQLARVALALSGLRLVALAVAVMAIAAVLGAEAVIGIAETSGIILTVGEAIGALLVAGIAARRTRPQ